jgi:hypothetical protein
MQEITTQKGCTIKAEVDFGMVSLSIANFPTHASVFLPMKDALELANMIYSLAGADDKQNYLEAA